MGNPPPLPPRNPTDQSLTSTLPRKDTIHLTPQTASQNEKRPYLSTSWSGQDPRSSSMSSLRPVDSDGYRRRLLLVYIHGFLGNETSFKSFPAHVHNLLTLSLSETHAVHTKIYPRYKSRKDISYARDDFSNWLYPHESSTTDVILLGHSLGGILAAEVALLHSHTTNSTELYQHRILGIIAFDTPFLGMHPSVIKTGLASLFRPSPELPNQERLSPSRNDSLSPSDSFFSDPFSPPADPNYNPSFLNDVIRPNRSKLENAWYFWNKHCGEMTKATKSYVTSHFEFGGCLADYPGLKKRYEAVRALEDIDESTGKRDPNGKLFRRVRFVNYYSASTGRIKPEKNKLPTEQPTTEMQDLSSATTDSSRLSPSISTTPRLSLEEHQDGELITKEIDDIHLDDSDSSLQLIETSPRPMPMSDSTEIPEVDLDLPPIPPEPKAPLEFDPTKYNSKDGLKLAQKDHERQVKAYQRAKKDREKSLRDREKLFKKREKMAAKEQAKAGKLTKAKEDLEKKEILKRSTTLNPETYERQLAVDATEQETSVEQLRKKKKDKKFCSLPAKDPQTGLRDSTWIRVYMEGIDEVVAHTSLFFISETYAKLVGDTAARIEAWVHEDDMKESTNKTKS